jgi:CRP-like cAMP-binding protein
MEESLKTQEVFQFLRPDQVKAISEASETIRCLAGETVYERGARADHFFTVLEGEVALRLPGRGNFSIAIDQLTRKAMFGACVCFNRDSYALTAQCVEDSVLLKTENAALKKLMDEDLLLGYRLQTRISEVYFNRYNDTMKKLQSIVMNIPLEAG